MEKTLDQPKLEFLKTRNPDAGRVAFKVTLGVMPDYTFEGPGMRIDGVSDNKPAAKAGLQGGDILVKLGDDEVKDVHAYMKALAKFKKGDTAKVEILRNGVLKELSVTF
jgi:S1-C subfamily serine protease